MKGLVSTICLTLTVLVGIAEAGDALPPCPSDQNRYYVNCFGTYTHANGDKYVGEYRDDKGNGQGTKVYVSSGKEEGIWKYDKFQYAQKVTPTALASKPPSPTPRKRADSDKVVAAASGRGSAVSSKGHVITNHHVIEGYQNVKIHYSGKAISATVVTYDPRSDLALLKGDFNPTAVLPLSNTRPVLLQNAYVAGYPFGRKISRGVKVIKGIDSSLKGIGNNFSQIQIDAALQPGNSGGPILDDKGNVIGVAVAKLDIKKILEDFGVIPKDTNFGVRVSMVQTITDSADISLPSPNILPFTKSKLGKMISEGTYYLSC